MKLWFALAAVLICTAAEASYQDPLVGAATQSQPANPVSPASTTLFKMSGLAGTITPKRSGTVLIVISGFLTSTAVTAGVGIQVQISHGTGTAPVNAATLTGTQDGAVMKYTIPSTAIAADVMQPFSVNAVVTGLTKGTAYWIDLAAESIVTASVIGISNISISAFEQ